MTFYKVSVVELIYKTYEKLERKPHQLPELIEKEYILNCTQPLDGELFPRKQQH